MSNSLTPTEIITRNPKNLQETANLKEVFISFSLGAFVKAVLSLILLLSIVGCEQSDSENNFLANESSTVIAGNYFAGEGETKHRWTSPDILGSKKIVLSYDDHPGPKTDRLLKLLRERNVKVTFFYNTKNLKTKSETIQRIIKDGHILGSHNHVHNSAASFKTESNFKKNLKESISTIEQAYENAGVVDNKGVYFRYPYGATAKTDQLDSYQIIQDAGYELYGENCINYSFWDIDTIDWKLRDSDKIVQNVVSQLEGGVGYVFENGKAVEKYYPKGKQGGVILMHDKGTEYILEATRKIIDWAQDNDYEIVALSDVEGYSFDDRECVYQGK